MKQIYLPTLWVISMLLTMQMDGLGQDCTQQLKTAMSMFEGGQPEYIPELLLPCLEKKNKSFSRQEKIQAYRLLTISYLLEQEDSLAQVSFKQLLDLDPLHQIDVGLKENPAELLYLYESFQTHPVWFVSAQFGFNMSIPQVLQERSIAEDALQYIINPGLQVGVNLSKAIQGRNWRIHTGLHYAIYEFETRNMLHTGFGQPKQIQLLEQQRWIQIPLSLSYDFEKKSAYSFQYKAIYPFVKAGVRIDRLLKAEYSEVRRDNNVSSSQTGLDQGDIGLQRQALQVAAHIGGGVKIKVDRFHFFLDARYSFWPHNMVRNPYTNHELIYLYGHVDHDLRLHHAAIHAGIEWSIFQHKLRHSSRKSLTSQKLKR